MLVETIRLKLPRPYKARFDQEFKAGLAEPATPAAAAALVGLTRALMKSQRHLLRPEDARQEGAGLRREGGRRRLYGIANGGSQSALVDLKSTRAARRLLEEARRKFPANPMFPYLLALTYMTGELEQAPLYQVRPLLEEARRLAEALPPDARREKLLRDVAGPAARPGRRQPVRHGVHGGLLWVVFRRLGRGRRLREFGGGGYESPLGQIGRKMICGRPLRRARPAGRRRRRGDPPPLPGAGAAVLAGASRPSTSPPSAPPTKACATATPACGIGCSRRARKKTWMRLLRRSHVGFPAAGCRSRRCCRCRRGPDAGRDRRGAGGLPPLADGRGERPP